MAIFRKNNSMFKFRVIMTIIAGLVMTVIGFSTVIGAAAFRSDVQKHYEKGENYIPEMKYTDYSKGMNVYGDILYSYGCFCEETETENASTRVTGSYYLMPIWDEATGDERYVTVLVKKKTSVSALEDITADTRRFFDGEEVDWHDFFMFGKVKPLDKEVREIMIDSFRKAEWFDSYDDATMNKYIVPYQIVEYDPDSSETGGWIIAGIGLAVLVIFAIIFIVVYAGRKNKQQDYLPPQDTQPVQRGYEPPPAGAYQPPQSRSINAGAYSQPQQGDMSGSYPAPAQGDVSGSYPAYTSPAPQQGAYPPPPQPVTPPPAPPQTAAAQPAAPPPSEIPPQTAPQTALEPEAQPEAPAPAEQKKIVFNTAPPKPPEAPKPKQPKPQKPQSASAFQEVASVYVPEDEPLEQSTATPSDFAFQEVGEVFVPEDEPLEKPAASYVPPDMDGLSTDDLDLGVLDEDYGYYEEDEEESYYDDIETPETEDVT